MPTLEKSTYVITNVKEKNIAWLEDWNDDTPITGNATDDPLNGVSGKGKVCNSSLYVLQ